MRALVCEKYGSPDDLALRELDDPVAAPGEILVDIKAAGLNFPDVLVISGQYQVKTTTPFIPGHEAAGIVAAVGEGADRFAVGDIAVLAAGMGELAGGEKRVQTLLIYIVQTHKPALPCKVLRGRQADTVCCACYKYGFHDWLPLSPVAL